MLSRKFNVSAVFKTEHKTIYPLYRLECIKQDEEVPSIYTKEFRNKVPAYFEGLYFTLFGN